MGSSTSRDGKTALPPARSAEGLVWNFGEWMVAKLRDDCGANTCTAFGANMNRTKLARARKITPVQSAVG